MVVLFLATLLAAVPSQAVLDRGRSIANLCECFSCHSPLKDLPYEEAVDGMLGAGDVLDRQQRKVAPNLTPDRATGAGDWSDGALIRAIRTGVGHDGRKLSLAMPYDYYSVMTDGDVGALVAYLRSLPAVRHELPRWTPKDVAEAPPEPLRPPLHEEDLRTPVDRGAYLVRLARCALCHSPRPAGKSWRHRRTDLEFGGGRRFSTEPFYDELDPDDVLHAPPAIPPKAGTFVASANITSDPSGIAFYDEGVFIETLRTGRVAGVRPLSDAMPWRRFRALADDDLVAIFRYLRSVAPVRHRVNNTEPPTFCRRCGRLHGLGDLNPP